MKEKASTPICPFVNEKAGATIMKEAERRYQKIREERREVSVRITHQENSNRVAGLAPDQPDASRLSECEWRHNTLPMS